MARKLVLVMVAVLAFVLVACTTSTVKRTGVVTGVAYAC